MPFILHPILKTMIDFYQKPRSMQRFQDYLKILKGNSKDDMLVPIGNFNPMGKEHVLEKLIELRELDVEAVIGETIKTVNKENILKQEFNVSLALADDLKGAWTNRFTTDYDSKFKLNALVARNFCTPLFWTSEKFSKELIHQRTAEACYRTIYWLNRPKPVTLKDHILQEAFVADKCSSTVKTDNQKEILNFYNTHKQSEEYSLIFNFLYGDEACTQLRFPVYGIKEENAGFKFAAPIRF